MGYLRFEKALMTNLEESLSRELLRTNRSGAYSCSTIVDCNTRKYHGLLVVPVPELDDENHVLLSSLDTTVIQHGAEFNLGLHKYNGENFNPKGQKILTGSSVEATLRARISPSVSRQPPMIPLRNIVDSRLFLMIRRAPCGASREMKLISPVMLMIPDVASVAIRRIKRRRCCV